MFWHKLTLLCATKNISPNKVCADLGYSTAIATKWKKGSIPRDKTLQQIANYFGVTIDYFSEKENAPTPTRSECEEKILQHFRELSPEGQQALIKVVESMKKSSDKAQ